MAEIPDLTDITIKHEVNVTVDNQTMIKFVLGSLIPVFVTFILKMIFDRR